MSPSIHDRISLQGMATPGAVAVEGGGTAWTFSELERRVQAVAGAIRAAGGGPETVVCVCLDRSPELVAALLGVLRAGCAYLAVDPSYPAERIAHALADSGARLAVAGSGMEAPFAAAGVPVVRGGAEPEDGGGRPAEQVHPEQAAYLLYTSGSTGTPKGVVVPHRALAAHARSTAEAYALRAGDRVLQFASPAFDVAAEEIFPTLAAGATVVLRDEEAMGSMERFLAFVARRAVTVLNLPAGFWHALVAALERPGTVLPPSVRLVVAGSEAVAAERLARWRRLAPEVAWRNAYGVTEATITVSLHIPGDDLRTGEGTVPIGQPLAGVSLYLLDPVQRPAPAGSEGELCIGGVQVARGYHRRAALTAERFVPDPFAEAPGARMYRTGDLARALAGGDLEFRGRSDGQLKVRGYRVEPGEVEAALLRHAQVASAAVGTGGAGDRPLVAWVAAETRDPELLRDHLARLLPAHMVPTRFVFLDELPRTPGGKVDRAALPPPGEPGDGTAEPPETATEATVAAIWREVLHAGEVGRDADFFALGGSSLSAMQVASRLHDALDADVPLHRLVRTPVLRDLAAWMDAERSRRDAIPPVVPVPHAGPQPLSPSQARAWFVQQLGRGSLAYQFQAVLRWHGPLRVEALERALSEVVRRHEVFRTVFPTVGGEPRQVVTPPVPVRLPLTDLSHLPLGRRAGEAQRRTAEEVRRPLDLAAGPPVRWALVRLDQEIHDLVHVEHHIVHDGWSFNVFLHELLTLYRAFVAGEPSPLAAPAVQFLDHVHWEGALLEGPRGAAAEAYWTSRLHGAPAESTFPPDRPRPPVQGFRGGLVRAELDPQLCAALRETARREGVTLFMAMYAAFVALLHRYTGQDDLCVGTGVANRRRPEVEAVLGMFVNSVVLRTDLGGDPRVRELLARVRTACLEAYEHDALPFDRVVRTAAPERTPGRHPLHQLLFSFDDARMPEVELPGVRVEVREGIGNGSAKFDMNVIVAPRAAHAARFSDGWLAEGITLLWEFDEALYDRAGVERVVAHYRTLLREICAHPGARLSALPLLTPAEAAALVAESSGGEAGPFEPAVRAFAERARLHPALPAVAWGGEEIAYAALEARSARLAVHLRALGAAPEARVALCLPRTPEMVVALLATLRTGAAYVALDPVLPAERLRYMLADAGAGIVVTTGGMRESFGDPEVRVVCVDSDREAIAAHPPRFCDIPVSPDNLAHVIYTSGSTGRPKGVMVCHRGVSAFLHWMRERLHVAPGERVLAATSLSFDVHVAEIHFALASGATLVLAENALALAAEHPPAGLVQASMVPSAAAALARMGALPAGLRRLNLGGEPVSPELARTLHAAGVEEVGNAYGPTEDTTYTTFATVPAGAERVVLGRPVAGSSVYVLDGGMRLVPDGVVGEAYLAGEGISRGYLARPGLTAERYLPDPLGADGGRLYRTGDRVRRRPGGDLEYLGRTDFQLKVRGHRVELGEIEAVLLLHPAVAEAVVVPRGEGEGTTLAAYVAPVDLAAPPSAEALRAHLRERLPEPMLPAALTVLAALPRAPGGKVSRDALPRPESPPPPTAGEAPRTAVEEAMAALWSEVLEVERPARDADFFALGGHSLLAARLVSRIRDTFGAELPLRTIFESPTVAELAARAAVEAPAEELPVHPAPRDRPIPASFAQERLWFLERWAPGAAYNLPAVLRLAGPLDEGALEQALSALAARHEALRTRLVETEAGLLQEIDPPAPVPLPREDHRSHGRAGALRRAEALAREPFDLEAGPLFRAALLRGAENEHLLVLVFHHAIADGATLDVLARELGALYAAGGSIDALPVPPVQLADYAAWQRTAAGGALDAKLGWWRRRLEGAPEALDLPADHPRPAVRGTGGDALPFAVPADAAAALRALARSEGATLFMAGLAAFLVLLGRRTGASDLVVGTPVSGRTRRELEGVAGLLVNMLALRVDLTGDPTFAQLLARVREATLEAYARQDVPLERIVEAVTPRRDTSRTPLFQVVFQVEGTQHLPGLPGVEAEWLEVETRTSKFDLTLALRDVPGGLPAVLRYSTELFEAGTATEMAHDYLRVLDAAVGAPDLPLSGLPLPAGAEARPRPPAVVRIPRIAATGGVAATPTERVLARLFAEVLEREEPERDEDFFELGGHSLLATRVVAAIRGRLGVQVPLRAIFEAPTVAGLATRVESAPPAPAAPRALPRPAPRPASAR